MNFGLSRDSVYWHHDRIHYGNNFAESVLSIWQYWIDRKFKPRLEVLFQNIDRSRQIYNRNLSRRKTCFSLVFYIQSWIKSRFFCQYLSQEPVTAWGRPWPIYRGSYIGLSHLYLKNSLLKARPLLVQSDLTNSFLFLWCIF